MYLPYYLLAGDKKYTKYFYFAIFENPSKDLMKMIRMKLHDLPKMVMYIQNPDSPDSARPIFFPGEFAYTKMKNFLDRVKYTLKYSISMLLKNQRKRMSISPKQRKF